MHSPDCVDEKTNMQALERRKDVVTTLVSYLQSWDFTDRISGFEH